MYFTTERGNSSSNLTGDSTPSDIQTSLSLLLIISGTQYQYVGAARFHREVDRTNVQFASTGGCETRMNRLFQTVIGYLVRIRSP